MEPTTLGIGDHVKTLQGRPGTIDEVCEEFFHVKFDEPIRDVLGWSTGAWERIEHIQKMPALAPRMPQDQRNT